MKYGLKPYMADLTIEIVVCKWDRNHYEIHLQEKHGYMMDDPYCHQFQERYTTYRSTKPVTDKLFAYLVQMGFYKVKRTFIDIS